MQEILASISLNGSFARRREGCPEHEPQIVGCSPASLSYAPKSYETLRVGAQASRRAVLGLLISQRRPPGTRGSRPAPFPGRLGSPAAGSGKAAEGLRRCPGRRWCFRLFLGSSTFRVWGQLGHGVCEGGEAGEKDLELCVWGGEIKTASGRGGLATISEETFR